jgi:hypothetical protein
MFYNERPFLMMCGRLLLFLMGRRTFRLVTKTGDSGIKGKKWKMTGLNTQP